jgi:uncharacterized protein YjbJ (UPF0337 family)
LSHTPIGYLERTDVTTTRSRRVSTDDKFDNKAQVLKGKAKEALGHATDNQEWKAEGKKDQTVGNLKSAGEKIKDAFKS